MQEEHGRDLSPPFGKGAQGRGEPVPALRDKELFVLFGLYKRHKAKQQARRFGLCILTLTSHMAKKSAVHSPSFFEDEKCGIEWLNGSYQSQRSPTPQPGYTNSGSWKITSSEEPFLHQPNQPLR